MDLAACRRSLVVIVVGLIAAASVLGGWVELIVAADQPPIDFQRARGLLERERRGEKLSTEEQQYLNRAREARRQGMSEGRGQGPITPKDSVGLVPLCDLTGDERYKGEDGGLYGHGQNSPPEAHRRAAEAELARIQPLNAQGQPAKDGKVVLVSISMSNATQEFSVFKRLADAAPQKSPLLTIVDCAQGGQAMAEWAERKGGPWTEADRRLAAAGVSPSQIQTAWIKLANKGPRGDLAEHGKQLQRDTLAVLHNAKARFPNLRVTYLSSRIYGGYAATPLNPEPYAYESAFAARWLILDQMKGDATLNFDPSRGEVKAPLLLWGPYLWADGATPRKADGLVWKRDDLGNDGTHPSLTGREKVAKLLLEFFKTSPLAKPWFVAAPARNEAPSTGR